MYVDAYTYHILYEHTSTACYYSLMKTKHNGYVRGYTAE